MQSITRREALSASGMTVGAVLGGGIPSLASTSDRGTATNEPFGYCLNTSTISGQKLGIVEVIEIASKAGYEAIEPWIRELDEYTKQGGSLRDLGKRLRDLRVSVESAIGFANWIVDDDARRAQGFEEAKRNLDMLAQMGAKRLAAPPAGATDVSDLDLSKAAERYRKLLELGDQFGVVPQVEVWGFSKSIQRLSAATFVAMESDHPKACVLADVYHLYKGGSPFSGLQLINGAAMHVMHMNDYPADPPREQIGDAQRVYPGDGIAPLDSILRTLHDIGFRGFLSLELFNRDYWKQDAAAVARTGLEKMRAAVQKALA
jgi:sugar phosphate isomerase/epimerase